MQMDVQMAVDVVQLQAGGVKFRELLLHFRPQLAPAFRLEKIPPTRRRRVFGKSSVHAGQMRDSLRRQRRPSADQGEMQSHAESRILPRQPDRLAGCRFVDHQAGAGQNAVAMRPDHRLINRGRSPKIIRIDN